MKKYRIYWNGDFVEGARIELPEKELKYLTVNRWNSEPIELFNRKGQIAIARIDGHQFLITEISESSYPVYPISMALALPERDILFQAVRQLSELGLQRLAIFPGDRSQAAKKRMENLAPKLEKIALESMRQCLRPRVLQIDIWDAIDQGFGPADKIWFCDEAGELALDLKEGPDSLPDWIVVGPEGGWSPQERDQSRVKNWKPIHFPLPVLRVETAVTVGAFFAVMRHINAR